MKNILKLFLGSLLLSFVFIACKKDEYKNYFEGGTAPVLTASTIASQVLLPTNKDNQSITFSWTNPRYTFTSGVSSQNVSYILQVDKSGSNLSSPDIQELSI